MKIALLKKLMLVLLFLAGCGNYARSQTTLTTAVDFTATDTQGNTRNLFDILADGKYVLINFFFTTNGPGQEAEPSIVSAYNRFGSNQKDVVFIGVTPSDNNAECLAYSQAYGVQYPIISNDAGVGQTICDAYHVTAYPTIILIKPDKTIIEQDIWPVSGLESTLLSYGLEEYEAPPVPVFYGLAGEYTAGSAAVQLKVTGTGSAALTLFKVNGAAATEFNPATVGTYLVEAASADGKLRIWKYVKVK